MASRAVIRQRMATRQTVDIYVMASEGGPVKIGVTRQITSRVSTLCAASPYPITVAYMAFTDDDPFLLEAYVHHMLAAKRLNAEWFDIEAAEAIATIREAASNLGTVLTEKSIPANLRERGNKRQAPKGEIIAALEARGVAFTPDGVRTNG